MEAIVHWLIDTPGIGAIIVIAIGLGVLTIYGLTIRWIQSAPPDSVVVTANEPSAKSGTDGRSNSPDER
jgi:hypothetical protein